MDVVVSGPSLAVGMVGSCFCSLVGMSCGEELAACISAGLVAVRPNCASLIGALAMAGGEFTGACMPQPPGDLLIQGTARVAVSRATLDVPAAHTYLAMWGGLKCMDAARLDTHPHQVLAAAFTLPCKAKLQVTAQRCGRGNCRVQGRFEG